MTYTMEPFEVVIITIKTVRSDSSLNVSSKRGSLCQLFGRYFKRRRRSICWYNLYWIIKPSLSRGRLYWAKSYKIVLLNLWIMFNLSQIKYMALTEYEQKHFPCLFWNLVTYYLSSSSQILMEKLRLLLFFQKAP